MFILTSLFLCQVLLAEEIQEVYKQYIILETERKRTFPPSP